jgi:hypothetical protein
MSEPGNIRGVASKVIAYMIYLRRRGRTLGRFWLHPDMEGAGLSVGYRLAART